MLARIALLCLTQTPSLICPPGTRLERTTTAEETWTGCVDDQGRMPPSAVSATAA
jgi:hypothetical protein